LEVDLPSAFFLRLWQENVVFLSPPPVPFTGKIQELVASILPLSGSEQKDPENSRTHPRIEGVPPPSQFFSPEREDIKGNPLPLRRW